MGHLQSGSTVRGETGGLNELSRLHMEHTRQRYPTLPDHAIIRHRYKDDTSNGLAEAIRDYITFCGGYCVRINVQGQWNKKLERFTQSTTRKGTADLHACFKGKHLSIEIKMPGDSQSKEQKETEQDIIRAGGLYFIARDFDSFKFWMDGV